MLRTDSLATLYFFHPLARSVPRTGVRVPILMYHSVSEGDRSGTHPYYQTVTSPSVFARHMQFLSENGFTPIGVGDALNCLRAATRTVERPVVITFDDGYLDFYTNAFPILQRYGFTATMYLPTAYIGAEQRFNGLDCLTWSQVRELHQAGIEFGAHTSYVIRGSGACGRGNRGRTLGFKMPDRGRDAAPRSDRLLIRTRFPKRIARSRRSCELRSSARVMSMAYRRSSGPLIQAETDSSCGAFR